MLLPGCLLKFKPACVRGPGAVFEGRARDALCQLSGWMPLPESAFVSFWTDVVLFWLWKVADGVKGGPF